MIEGCLQRSLGGERLTPEEGVALLASGDLADLGAAAEALTRLRHPEAYRTYNIDRNINYTNVCCANCDFCAFSRRLGSPEAYVLPRDVLLAKVADTVQRGGEQILLQGGLHPDLRLDWYEQTLAAIKQQFPQVNIHGFSPPEIDHFARLNRLSVHAVLERLRDAGLGSIPGGGAEILVDRVRRQITRGKVLTNAWLEVMRTWHNMGGRSTATMMFGHVESLADRIEHLDRLRRLQDETGGFTAFIAWTFQPAASTRLRVPKAGAFAYLKTLAVARLFLDNFPHFQASWVTQGLKIGQLALLFGADDMGSLMLEENVVAQAGTAHQVTLPQIRAAIRELGFEPRQRNVFYQLVPQRG